MVEFVEMSVSTALEALQWADRTGVWRAEYGAILEANPARVIKADEDFQLMLNCVMGRGADGINPDDFDRGLRFLKYWGCHYTENYASSVAGDILVRVYKRYLKQDSRGSEARRKEW